MNKITSSPIECSALRENFINFLPALEGNFFNFLPRSAIALWGRIKEGAPSPQSPPAEREGRLWVNLLASRRER